MNTFHILVARFIIYLLEELYFFDTVNGFPFCGKQTAAVYGFRTTINPPYTIPPNTPNNLWSWFPFITFIGGPPSIYGYAILKAINTVYDALSNPPPSHQCFVLISSGNGTPPTFEHWALLTLQSHLAKMGCCMCTMCISIGPLTPNFNQTCQKLGVIQPHETFVLNSPTPYINIWNLALNISNFMYNRILNNCSCECVNMPFMPPN